jgi:hypothetical protein
MCLHENKETARRRAVLSPIVLLALGNLPLLNPNTSEHRKDAVQATLLRREHRSPSHRSTLSCRRLKCVIPAMHHIAAVLTKAPPEIVIVDKMPPVESADDRSAILERDIKIPQRWYCAEDPDQLEYLSAFGRNTFGIPPYCKGNWQGKEDWKPRQREGEGAGND